MAAGKGVQFLLLLWKNWIIQKRRIICTIFEIAVPILLSLLLLLLRQAFKATSHDSMTTWPSFAVNELPLRPPASTVPNASGWVYFDDFETNMWQVAYAPSNPATDKLMASVASHININVTGYNFSSEEEFVQKYVKDKVMSKSTLAAVIFTGSLSGGKLSATVEYKIRPFSLRDHGDHQTHVDWMTDKQFLQSITLGPREAWSDEGGDPGYHYNGFLALQHAVDAAIIGQQTNLTPAEVVDRVPVTLQRYPFPPWYEDSFVYILYSQVPLFVMITFLFTAPCIVKDIVLEKERKLKETMKLMGISNWLHWAAWFVKYFIFLLLAVVAMTILYSIDLGKGAVINHTDPTLLFVFLVIYTVSVIMFCFALSVFFSSANVAAVVCGIFFFLSYYGYSFQQQRYFSLSTPAKLAISLLPNSAMGFSFLLISLQEGTGVGMQWSNFHKPVNINDQVALLHYMLMLLADSAICAVIVWYVDAVKPGDFGVPLPWYFPFTKWYWCGTAYVEKDGEMALTGCDASRHEPLADGQPIGVKVRGLRKVFNPRSSSPMVAVDSLDLDLVEGQITALLGHNGAGKTTTMCMLTGFLEPTLGSAVIGGYDIRRNLNKVRENLGLCPQHDVLFDSLTVTEHLWFFGKLKECQSLDKEVDEMITRLNLKDKAGAQAHTLSGGMKRKLSVGVALIGNPSVVILDEPTSGMDPEARRQTWDILQTARRGRTMLLTTHFMDEADYLGDRIAIMASGKLVCSGSSLFLKKRYGVGYHMNIVKTEGCVVKPIEKLIKEFVPNAQVESDAGAELSFVLPSESSDRFEELFNILDREKQNLGISSWGASVTTMEEVFLKVGEDHQQMEDNGAGTSENDDSVSASQTLLGNTNRGDDKMEKNTGIVLLLQQFWAVLLKRVLYTWRSPLVNIVQISLPILFALLGCLLKYSYGKTLDAQPSLTLAFHNYDTPMCPFKGESDGEESTLAQLEQSFQTYMRDQGVVTSQITSGDNASAVIDYLAVKGEEDLEAYRNRYIVAGYFEAQNESLMARGFFNNEAIHSPPMALTAINNAILRYLASNRDLSIETTNHPLPLPISYKEDNLQYMNSVFATVVILIFAFGLSFHVATFILFPIEERSVGVKQSQYMSGLPVPVYWLGTYAWDLINFLLPCMVVIGLFYIFDIEGFIAGSNVWVCLLLFVAYGVAILPWVYLLSFVFGGATAGYSVTVVINVITGTVAMAVIGILTSDARENPDDKTGEIVEWVFYCLLPNFCFNQGMVQLSLNHFKNLMLEAFGLEGGSALAWQAPGVGRAVTFLFIQAVVFFALIFLFESGLTKRLLQKLTSRLLMKRQPAQDVVQVSTNQVVGHDSPMMPPNPEDSDVAEERARIQGAFQNELVQNEAIVLRGLTKHYGRLLAVDDLSLGISQGECFGLLGVNGAGKTTTFKMLTGEELVTGGDAYVKGFSVTGDIKQVRQKVGYCPQFNALLWKLTVRETLTMYGRLRGVREANLKRVVGDLIKKLLLSEHAGKRAGDLSGGNKRKLSTAVALIGEPPVLFLDEPTTGVDPGAKRQLWNSLIEARKAGRTIVLTSHSMEECEALCTRLVIMVNGQFRCLGASQHLKDKFSRGYTLMAKVTHGSSPLETHQRVVNLMNFVQYKFPSSVLKDYQPGLVLYQISSTDTVLAQVFGEMERNKSSLLVEDYSVSQTTLEQIFVNFARAQSEPQKTPATCGNLCASFLQCLACNCR